MAATMPPTYQDAALSLYAAGRAARKAGQARTDSKAAGHPDNPAAWDQSYKANPIYADFAGPKGGSYGPVGLHWFFGWDDEANNWPDRGWAYSMSRHAVTNFGFDGVRRFRDVNLSGLYSRGWIAYLEDWSKATFPPGEGVTAEDAKWEFLAGQNDRKLGNAPPVLGFKEPPPPLPATPSALTPVAQNPPQSNNFFQMLLTFKLLEKFLSRNKKKQ